MNSQNPLTKRDLDQLLTLNSILDHRIPAASRYKSCVEKV